MRVLLLNASEEVLNVIAWQRAVILYLQGKVRKPYGHDEFYPIKTATGVFQLPTALILVSYVRIPYKKVAISRENLMRRDNYECQYCGVRLNRKTGTVDHVVPKSKGGKHTWANVVAACKKCNNKKDNRTPVEAGMKLRCRPFVPARDVMLISAIDLGTNKTWTRWLMT